MQLLIHVKTHLYSLEVYFLHSQPTTARSWWQLQYGCLHHVQLLLKKSSVSLTAVLHDT